MSFKVTSDIRSGKYGFWKAATKTKPSQFIPLGKAVYIRDITVNIENNEARLKLSLDYMGESKSITISRAALADNTLLPALSKIGANVPKHHFDVLVDSLMLQEERMESNGYRPTKVYSHLGWMYVPMRDAEGNITHSELHYRASRLLGGCSAKYDGPYSVTPMGSYDQWRNMVVKDVIGHTALELVLLAGLSAVVNGLISPLTTGESPIFHLYCGSSQGKTTALGLASSVSGVPYDGEKRSINKQGEIVINRSIYGSWGSTENATTAQCSGNKGAPIILNELGKFEGKDMSRTVYHLSEGTDKARLNMLMQVYTSESYATSIISAGEVSLIGRCVDKVNGLYNRVMEIDTPLTTDPDHSRRIKSACRKHNGWAAAMLAQYILDNGGVDLVLPIYTGYCDSLLSTLPNTASSARFIEKFTALIMTTAELSSKALNIPFDTAGILNYFVQYETDHGNQRNASADSYRVVIEACRTNKKSFYIKGEPDPAVKSFGRISYPNKILTDGRVILEEYAIRRSFLEQTLAQNNFPNISTCVKEWKTMGVLDCDADRPTRSRLIDKSAGKTEDVFVLRVFAEATGSIPTNAPLKSKLVKKAISPSPQLTAILNDTKEEDEQSA